jgi:cell division protein FtsA
VNVGVAGEHITSMRHRNYVTISGEDREITRADLDRLEADVRTIRIPSDRQILHIIPEEFSVDYQGGIENPIGMSGSRLEATNHIVLASIPAMQNIRKSVERAGFQVQDYILQPIASSSSVLEESEKDLGVALIDIGGGTTDIAIFHKKAIKHTKVIGVAGNQVTNDIRESLGVITEEAEKLKKEFGYATESAIIKDEDILIRGVGARGNAKIPISLLTQIISLRMRELFSLIDNEIRSAGFKNKIKAGIVLTGGGSLLKGCTELAEEVFGLPSRIGVPQELGAGLSDEIESPEFATVAGLIRGIPGGKSSELQVLIRQKKVHGKNKISLLVKRVQQFFDEL